MLVSGEEPVVRQTLELLCGAAYNGKFAAKSPVEEPGLLNGIRLLKLALRLNERHRVAIPTVVGIITAPINIQF